MKKMNRREFLTLSGAAVVALSLAGCGGGSSAPAVPTGKEAELVAAINKVWKEKYATGAVDHEQLTLNQDAVDLISAYGHILEKANKTTHQLTPDDGEMYTNGYLAFETKLQKYGGGDSLAGTAGVLHQSANDVVTLEDEYSCADAAVRAFVDKLLTSNSNSLKAEFISIYCPVVQGKTYMTAVVFRNNNP
jgi:hypothetical protein